MSIWLIIFGMALVTFGIRYSFVALPEQRSLPDIVQRALQFVPVAVLTALIIPDLLTVKGAYDLSLANGRMVAALVATLVAWRTRSVMLTIVVGMAVLYAVQSFAK